MGRRLHPNEVNHRKFGSKWTLPKAKKFFKAVLGTDKFVQPESHGAGNSMFYFQNDHVWFTAYMAYGSKVIELKSHNPYETIGIYDFVTFEKQHDLMYAERDRSWKADKEQIIGDHLDWLNTLADKSKPRFEREIQKIIDGTFDAKDYV
ncbi:hypothetical protein [Paenibacillus silvisoli]|uniref:hypothetical protein n=1 Tax=Paenibacillus silvisoli TaxID=3110539 RepID=UPI002804ADBB|nr:hypothetical protein [Paenibacillus silvisoli]